MVLQPPPRRLRSAEEQVYIGVLAAAALLLLLLDCKVFSAALLHRRFHHQNFHSTCLVTRVNREQTTSSRSRRHEVEETYLYLNVCTALSAATTVSCWKRKFT